MLVRLLLVVLMLAGPSPAGACTCAASACVPEPTSTDNAPPPPASESGCSKCRAKAASTAGRLVAAFTAHTCDHHFDGHHHPEPGDKQHDQHCPAVNPPQVVAAVSPAPDLPTAESATVAVPFDAIVPGPVCARHDRDEYRHFGAPPLYISLLTLRN